ncbi:MAG TPA: S1 RNA-binding domain-containing protein, partial [Desulfobacterales bacterium]|nr:S1 RNA-binding domain-containing protein [Desulfobacterales bacterium]
GGSIRAFCPYSQMGLRRVEDAAAEYVEKRMQFLITRFEENGRNIVVSARELLELEREKLRDSLKETLTEGQTIEGVITSIREFGAFVDIGGVDGLVPISEIGWSRVENINDYYAVDQKVSVLVKKLDWDNNRITLSIKGTLEDPWEEAAAKLSNGNIIMGKVVRLAQFGAFVSLEEAGVDGLIHISKLGKGRRINHPREVLEEGQEIEVQVESVDLEEKRISLAPSDYVSPEDDQKSEDRLVKDFKKSNKKQSATLGTFGDLLKAKLAEKS